MGPFQLDTGIVRELILSAGGDDDMGTLLGMMHSAPPSALQLKAHILKVKTIVNCCCWFSLSLLILTVSVQEQTYCL
jgi:hypothetical protein